MIQPPSNGVVVVMATWRKPQNRFTVQDRIEVLRWQADADRAAGRVAVCGPHSADDPEIGDYVLIYRRGEVWARWAVTREEGTYRVWCFADNRAVGAFASLHVALDAAAGLSVLDRRRAS